MRKSDEDRFREFARGNAIALRRSAYLLCGDWHLADDLVQTTLIKLHGAWPRVHRRHQPVSYARKILLRSWLDERRTRRGCAWSCSGCGSYAASGARAGT
jgi:DNA-directed RNA polymerase specialized sigma24 family protein